MSSVPRPQHESFRQEIWEIFLFCKSFAVGGTRALVVRLRSVEFAAEPWSKPLARSTIEAGEALANVSGGEVRGGGPSAVITSQRIHLIVVLSRACIYNFQMNQIMQSSSPSQKKRSMSRFLLACRSPRLHVPDSSYLIAVVAQSHYRPKFSRTRGLDTPCPTK